jgi:hypothetical protein
VTQAVALIGSFRASLTMTSPGAATQRPATSATWSQKPSRNSSDPFFSLTSSIVDVTKAG